MWYNTIVLFWLRCFFRREKIFQEVSCGVLKVCLSHIRNKFRYSENAEKRPILSKFIAFLRSGNMFFRRLRYSNRLYQISQALSRAKSRFKERLPIFRKNVKNRLQIGGQTTVSLLRQTVKTVRKDKVHKNFIICRNFQGGKVIVILFPADGAVAGNHRKVLSEESPGSNGQR